MQKEIAKNFWILTNAALDRFQPDTKLSIFRKLLKLRACLDDLWFIKVAGPFFYKYRESIAARDLDFFINLDYVNQRRDWMELTRGHGEGIAQNFENAIKTNLTRLKDEDPEFIEQITMNLLRLYSQFILAERVTQLKKS